MSTRTNLRPQLVLNTAPLTTSQISAPTVMQSLSKVSYSLTWTGAPVGTVSVQVSNDYALNPEGGVANPGTWNTLTLNIAGSPTTTIPITAPPGNGFIDIYDTAAYACRLIYTFTSGTGTMTVYVNGKVA